MSFLDRLRTKKSKTEKWEPIVGDQIILTENCLRLKLRESGKPYVKPGAIGEIVDMYDFMMPTPNSAGELQAQSLLKMTKMEQVFIKVLSAGAKNANMKFYDIKIGDYTAQDMPRYVKGDEVFVRVEENNFY